MHVITFVDPCFGAYIRVRDEGFVGEPWSEILIGPLFTRTLSIEYLDNIGQRATFRESTEKPCFHYYGDGSIRGEVVPAPVNNWNRATIPAETASYDYTTVIQPEPCQWCAEQVPPDTSHGMSVLECLGVVELTVSETEYVATFFIRVDYHECWRHIDDVQHWKPFGRTIFGRFECDIRRDPLTGTKEYCNPRLSDPPYPGSNIIVDEVANPYGIYEDALGGVREVISDMVTNIIPDPDSEVGHMAKRDEAIYAALDNISLAGINPLSDFQDSIAPLQPLVQLLKLLRVRSVFDVFKNLGSLHLMYKYVLKTNLLTISECKKLVRTLRNPRKLLSSLHDYGLLGQGESEEEFVDGDLSIAVKYNAKMRYICDPKSFDNFLDIVNLLGLTPRITDLWDDLPLSFVLDWLVPIGDAVNNLELNNIQQRVPFNYGILTTKVKTSISRKFGAPNRNFTIDLSVVAYKRRIIHEFPSNVWFGVSLQDPSRQLLTGGALLLQFM